MEGGRGMKIKYERIEKEEEKKRRRGGGGEGRGGGRGKEDRRISK